MPPSTAPSPVHRTSKRWSIPGRSRCSPVTKAATNTNGKCGRRITAAGISARQGSTHGTRPRTRERPHCDYEMVYMLVKQEDYYYDEDAAREPAKCADDPRRGSRVDYNGKYDGTTGFGQQSFAAIREDGTRNLRSVWSIPSDRSD